MTVPTGDARGEAPVLFEVGDDGVAIVTLNRPEALNIVNLRMRDALIAAFTATRDHPGARCLLLRANGRHFSAGADVTEFGTAESLFEARRIRSERDPWGLLWELPQPSVVALHGYALGSGLEMALLCDVRLAAEGTRVGLPEVKLGMLPAAGGTQSLARAVGTATALHAVLTAEPYEARAAATLGMVHRVVPAASLDAEALVVARALADLPTAAARAAKESLRQAVDLPLAEGLAAEQHLARMVGAPLNQSTVW